MLRASFAVGLFDLRLQNRPHVPRLDTDHRTAMTGMELYRHFVDAGHSIPTILVTAYPNDIDRTRALDDGVVCYLRKPVNDEHLIRCFREALRSDELPEENS
jgi:CheY-like chemotaxis protein